MRDDDMNNFDENGKLPDDGDISLDGMDDDLPEIELYDIDADADEVELQRIESDAEEKTAPDAGTFTDAEDKPAEIIEESEGAAEEPAEADEESAVAAEESVETIEKSAMEDSLEDEADEYDGDAEASDEKGAKKKRKFPIPLIIALAVCVAVLIVAVWQLSNIFIQYKEAEDEYEDLLQYVNDEIDGDDEDESDEDGDEDEDDDETVERVALSLLQAQNSDTVGWIEIPGTTISYPLMHTTDNSYYLNHTFSGKVNSSGCIFVETLNSGDFTDLHTIIYGHNMKNGSMFASLKNYSSASYLVAHPIIYIDLEDGTHAYQIFSVYSTDSDSETFTIGFAPDDEYAAFLEMLKENSEYDTGVSVSVEDYIITLSTCTNSGEDRYVVHAKKLY